MNNGQLRDRFSDANKCRQFFESIIWPHSRRCPHCGEPKFYEIKGTSVKVGTYEYSRCKRHFTANNKTLNQPPNQVWAADITYTPMCRGFMYLVVIMDWQSRKVLSWRLSNTLDADFCVEVLEDALRRYEKPVIFNTDQGAQFTSKAFTDLLKENHVKIRMDGKGRV